MRDLRDSVVAAVDLERASCSRLAREHGATAVADAIAARTTDVAEKFAHDQSAFLEPSATVDWQPENTTDLATAIARLERELPGWWWSVGSCHVSADASIGPDRKGPMAELLRYVLMDNGFHHDLQQPSTCGEALNACIDEALAAIAEIRAKETLA